MNYRMNKLHSQLPHLPTYTDAISHPPHPQEASDELYSRHLSHLNSEQPAAGALILTDRLHALHRGLLAGRGDLELALQQLQRQGRVTLTDVDGRPAVKFRLEGEPSQRPTVSELEKGQWGMR